MVVQKTIDNLKDRPHDEKKAVASGIAISVIVILLIGWGFLFVRRVQNTPVPSLENGVVPTDQFNMDLIRESARGNAYDPSDDLRNLRESAVQADTSVDAKYSENANTGNATPDQFGTTNGL